MLKHSHLARWAAIAGIACAPLLFAAPARAVDDDSGTGTADLSGVRAKIAIGDYSAALSELRGIAEDSQEVDVYNLLGFTLRKTGDYDTSLTYYKKALALKADYRPAHEYLGELYAETGHPDEARAELAQLGKLCPTGCEEQADLERALVAKGIR